MLSYDMGKRGNASRYDYLYRRIRHDIAHGNILPDEKLPSKRALARNLGVSVITVEAAYAQLIAEGYVRAEERRGYFACELSPVARGGKQDGQCGGQRGGDHLRGIAASGSIPENAIRRPSPASAGLTQFPAASLERRLASPGTSARMAEGVPAFASEGGPATPAPSSESAATALFPTKPGNRVMRRTLVEESSATLAQAALGAGSPRLRRAIAAYLREYRGMDVPAERIVVAAGSQTLYQLIIQLLGRDRAFAIESPGYPLLERMYDAQGARCASVPLAAGGIVVAALRESGASVAHVMPAHQFPDGGRHVRRPPTRFAQLVANGCGAGVFLRRAARPLHHRRRLRCGIPHVGAPDRAARERRCGGARHLFELVHEKPRCGIPHRLYGTPRGPRCAIRELKLGFYSNTVSPLEQLALARFIEQGHYERHVNRLRTHVKRLQDGLVGRVRESPLRRKSRSKGTDRGLYFSMRVRKGTQDRVVGALQAAGVRLAFLGKGPLAWSDAQAGGVGLRAQLRESQHRRTRLAVAPRGAVPRLPRAWGTLARRGARGGLHLRRGTVVPFSSQRLGSKRSSPAFDWPP